MKSFKEVLNEMEFEIGDKEDMVIDRIERVIISLENTEKKAKKLKEGKRLIKILDKIINDLNEEMLFVGNGEYS